MLLSMETAGFMIRREKRTTKLESTFGEWVMEEESKRKDGNKLQGRAVETVKL